MGPKLSPMLPPSSKQKNKQKGKKIIKMDHLMNKKESI